MSTSGDERPLGKKHGFIWLCAAAFCVIFSLVYNRFSHEVRSFFMSCLFLWPIGAAAWHFFFAFILRRVPGRLSRNLFNAGAAALCTGSALRGVFDIAGTSSSYVPALFAFGGALCAVGTAVCRLRRGEDAPLSKGAPERSN